LIYRPSKKAYLNPEKTLYSYEFANEEELIYKNPIRMIKIKMMDNTTKIFSVNESEPIYNILDMILDKLKISKYSIIIFFILKNIYKYLN